MTDKEKALQEFMNELQKIDPKDIKINWKHPVWKKMAKQHEAFKRFMGWR